MSKVIYEYISLEIPPGKFDNVEGGGKNVVILDLEGEENLRISFDGEAKQQFFKGITVSADEPYESFRIHNESSETVIVGVAYGFADINDMRFILTNQPGVSIPVNSAADNAYVEANIKTTGTASHDSIASRPTRKRGEVINTHGTNSIWYIGTASAPSGSSPFGIEIKPGDSFEFQHKNEVHFYENEDPSFNASFTFWEEYD